MSKKKGKSPHRVGRSWVAVSAHFRHGGPHGTVRQRKRAERRDAKRTLRETDSDY